MPLRYFVTVYLLVLVSLILATGGLIGQAFDLW